MLDALAGTLMRLEIDDNQGKIAAIENALILRAMRETSGNKSAAARLLGVHRKYIERKQNQQK